MRAKIVGATLAKSYLSETLRERKFDTVILDEASMASIPALWCASYLAETNIVIVGDFLQLPPIVMADTPMAKKWLGKDIFYHSGMQERARNNTHPDNFIMLNDQFRMESDIADIANMYYGAYKGLRSQDNDTHRVNERERFYDVNAYYFGCPTISRVYVYIRTRQPFFFLSTTLKEATSNIGNTTQKHLAVAGMGRSRSCYRPVGSITIGNGGQLWIGFIGNTCSGLAVVLIQQPNL